MQNRIHSRRALPRRGVFLGLAVASVIGCNNRTHFIGEAKFPGGVEGCEAKCTSEGLQAAAFVYAGEFSTACVCEPVSDPSRSFTDTPASFDQTSDESDERVLHPPVREEPNAIADPGASDETSITEPKPFDEQDSKTSDRVEEPPGHTSSPGPSSAPPAHSPRHPGRGRPTTESE